MQLRILVVGVDGSADSLHAIDWAAGLAQLAAAEVVAVHAIGLLEHFDDGTVAAHTHLDDIRERMAGEWCAPLQRAGVSYRCEAVEGVPSQVLMRVAADCAADLIVVGSRGLGDTPAGFLGSTSTRVAQEAPCAVLVVPTAG